MSHDTYVLFNVFDAQKEHRKETIKEFLPKYYYSIFCNLENS